MLTGIGAAPAPPESLKPSKFLPPPACRRHLNIRGKSANLPAITDKDWLDLKFGIDVGVDYYALSFVRSADVIYELKEYLAKHGAHPPRALLQGLARAPRHCPCPNN